MHSINVFSLFKLAAALVALSSFSNTASAAPAPHGGWYNDCDSCGGYYHRYGGYGHNHYGYGYPGLVDRHVSVGYPGNGGVVVRSSTALWKNAEEQNKVHEPAAATAEPTALNDVVSGDAAPQQ